MKLNRTGSNWNRLERNKINENWDIIEGSYNDVVGQITDEVVGHLIDSAKLIWKEPVDTVEDLPASAEVGETRMVREADPDGISYVYRYDGEKWEKIQAIDVTLVNEVDNRLSAQLAETVQQLQKRSLDVSLPPFNASPLNEDNHSNIQNAIDSLIGVGGNVLIPDGVYKISDSLRLIKGVSLVGISETSKPTLEITSSNKAVIQGNSENVIGNLIVKGTHHEQGNNSIGCITVEGNYTNTLIENCVVSDCDTGAGIRIGTNTSGIRVSNCTIMSCKMGIETISTEKVTIENIKVKDIEWRGFRIVGCKGGTFKNLTILNAGQRGISVEAFNGIEPSENINIYNVLIDGFGWNIGGDLSSFYRTGLRVSGTIDVHVEKVTIKNPLNDGYCVSFGDGNGDVKLVSLYLYGEQDTVADLYVQYQMDKLELENIFLYGSCRGGEIRTDNVRINNLNDYTTTSNFLLSDLNNVVIINSFFLGIRPVDVLIQRANNVTIKDCTFKDSSLRAIDVMGTETNNLIIRNNEFINCVTGVRLAGLVLKSNIIDNVFDCSTDNIAIAMNGTEVVINNNTSLQQSYIVLNRGALKNTTLVGENWVNGVDGLVLESSL